MLYRVERALHAMPSDLHDHRVRHASPPETSELPFVEDHETASPELPPPQRLGSNWRESRRSFASAAAPGRFLSPCTGTAMGSGFGYRPITSYWSKPPFRSQSRGLNKDDLRRLVEDYNSRSAGGRTPTDQLMPHVSLPASIEFADSFFETDRRLGKPLPAIGEVINVLNIANLTGYSTDQP